MLNCAATCIGLDKKPDDNTLDAVIAGEAYITEPVTERYPDELTVTMSDSEQFNTVFNRKVIKENETIMKMFCGTDVDVEEIEKVYKHAQLARDLYGEPLAALGSNAD